jgi:hypothetical protein
MRIGKAQKHMDPDPDADPNTACKIDVITPRWENFQVAGIQIHPFSSYNIYIYSIAT